MAHLGISLLRKMRIEFSEKSLISEGLVAQLSLSNINIICGWLVRACFRQKSRASSCLNLACRLCRRTTPTGIGDRRRSRHRPTAAQQRRICRSLTPVPARHARFTSNPGRARHMAIASYCGTAGCPRLRNSATSPRGCSEGCAKYPPKQAYSPARPCRVRQPLNRSAWRRWWWIAPGSCNSAAGTRPEAVSSAAIPPQRCAC